MDKGEGWVMLSNLNNTKYGAGIHDNYINYKILEGKKIKYYLILNC